MTWQNNGQILSGRFSGSCSEAYFGDYRLLYARSPNIGELGINNKIAKEPYNKVSALLVETDTCKKDGKGFKQSCPEENRIGFFFDNEMTGDWTHLNQTKILVYRSWIAEYAQVAKIWIENGKNKVMFQEPLKHAAIGEWIASGDLRYIFLNNLALLDVPGEFVCVHDGVESEFSFSPHTE